MSRECRPFSHLSQGSSALAQVLFGAASSFVVGHPVPHRMLSSILSLFPLVPKHSLPELWQPNLSPHIAEFSLGTNPGQLRTHHRLYCKAERRGEKKKDLERKGKEAKRNRERRERMICLQCKRDLRSQCHGFSKLEPPSWWAPKGRLTASEQLSEKDSLWRHTKPFPKKPVPAFASQIPPCVPRKGRRQMPCPPRAAVSLSQAQAAERMTPGVPGLSNWIRGKLSIC